MEKGVETSGKASGGVETDLLSVFTVNPSDYIGVSLINCKLNGSNYLTWSRAMLNALRAKNKVRMIDGSVPRPPEGDSNRAKWDMCNALVISWIFNTLDSELQSSVACATVAQTLWEDLRESHEPAHSLNKVHALILHEERQNMVVLSHESNAPDGAVFLSRATGGKLEMQGSGGNSNYGGQGGGIGGTTKTCYHCGRPGHIKSACWLLHGFPTNWDSRQVHQAQVGHFNSGAGQVSGLQAHHTQIGQSSSGLNQIGRLQAHQAQLGQASSGQNKLSRLSDMAFQKLLDFLGPDDDNMHPVSGKNFIMDRTTRKTIGVGELQGGVYYLRSVAIREQANRVISEETGDLWHMRLGHPSRRVKFNGINLELNTTMTKECDVCLRAK
ncbi:hypothetical protein CRG98_005266 [Punica granatum]|uniref:CCHC-type domain-containing protein n=1 Tax=Punica granatum TaxID=22663 RepID=A0A2I0L2K2_PUNGR|nr:hypothetical protein CRG98_005266 [Punica granatum]